MNNHEVMAMRQVVQGLFAGKLSRGYTLRDVYTYRDAQEAVLFHRVRLDPPPGSAEEKYIRPIHKAGGRWQLGEPPAPPRGKALYRLPELLRGDPARPVYVAEGEKAADALLRLGLPATTSGGAASAAGADWSALRGRKVRIWPDHDAAGARYGAQAAELAVIHAASVELLDVAALRLPDKGDAWDWRAANPGASIQDVEALPWRPWRPGAAPPPPAAAAESGPRLEVVCAADVEPEAVRWLWRERIAIGKLSIIAGNPGLGKSMLTADFAGHVTRGLPWVDGAPCPQGGVLLVSGEDGAGDTIRPRLDAAGADPGRVYILKAVRHGAGRARMLCLQSDIEAFEAFLLQHPDVRLVCIDPVTAYLGTVDSHNNADVRGVLQPLAELADRFRVAVVCITHLNKNTAAPAINRINGSTGFGALARAVFSVTRDHANPGRRLVTVIKSNVGQDGAGLAYRIGLGSNGAPRIEWEPEPVTMSADEALAQPAGERPQDDIKGWVHELLAEGPVPVRDIKTYCDHVGLPWRKVQAGQKDYGVDSFRKGWGRDARYYWQLRGKGKEKGEAPKDKAEAA